MTGRLVVKIGRYYVVISYQDSQGNDAIGLYVSSETIYGRRYVVWRLSSAVD